MGLTFAHGPAPGFDSLQSFKLESLQTPILFASLPILPQMTGGWPGVAVFKYGRDGDLDINWKSWVNGG